MTQQIEILIVSILYIWPLVLIVGLVGNYSIFGSPPSTRTLISSSARIRHVIGMIDGFSQQMENSNVKSKFHCSMDGLSTSLFCIVLGMNDQWLNLMLDGTSSLLAYKKWFNNNGPTSILF